MVIPRLAFFFSLTVPLRMGGGVMCFQMKKSKYFWHTVTQDAEDRVILQNRDISR